MSRRRKIIIGIIVILLILIIALIIWLVFISRSAPEPEVPSDEEIQVPSVLPSASAGLPEGGISVEEMNMEAGIRAIASTFAERFGSFSNESNFSNLDSLQDLMTVRMKAWVDNYKATQVQGSDDIYYGVTTQAVSVNIDELDEQLGLAEVTVTAQRSEARGSTVNPRTFYQDLKLDMAKADDKWKVDAAEWQ